MKKILQTAVLTMLLVLVSAPAWALGLGQLQLKSKLGEPLLAEIPVISADPAELENLQARLADPETFLRVGLPLPDRMVSDLRFALVYDGAGKPLIQVTSPGPVAMPMLTFLLEVDWGDGRLVREYSVLLAEPEAVAAASQPVIQAPAAAPSTAIVRDAAPIASAVPSAPAAPQPRPQPAPLPAAVPMNPAPAPPVATPTPIAATAPVAAISANAASRTVQAGDTLSGVAAQLRDSGQSITALMAALLRANPDAFINNDPNLLRRGATLAVPTADSVDQAGRDGSADALQDQIAGWRSTRGRAMEAVDVASARDDASPAPTAAAEPARSAAPRRVSDARLEIMPATASAKAGTGTRSGTGGEGDAEMTQQLQAARETIATRDAELAELKSRVAELETLQQQQAQLVQMKDGQLAAAQQQLQQRQQSSAATPVPPAANDGNPWVLIGAIGLPLLVVLGLAAWWMRRRRPVVVDAAAPSFTKAPPAPVKPAKPIKPMPVEKREAIFPPVDAVQEDLVPAQEPSIEPSALATPSWMGVAAQGEGDDQGDVDARAGKGDSALGWSVPTIASRDAATIHDAPVWSSPSVLTNHPASTDDRDVAPTFLPPGRGVFDPPPDEPVSDAAFNVGANDVEDERIALARTYIELDDEATARKLLNEVVNEGGPDVTRARRMLDGIYLP